MHPNAQTQLPAQRELAATLRPHFDRPVVIAVVAVRVMEVAVDEIVEVVAVRDGRVAAVRAVDVLGVVAAAAMIGRAGVGILRRHGNRVLLDPAPFLMMQMAVVQEIDMPLVLDRRVPATGAMLMRMPFVSLGGRHFRISSAGRATGRKRAHTER